MMTATNVVIADNPSAIVASRASKSVHSASPTTEHVFDFRHVLVFDKVQSVRVRS